MGSSAKKKKEKKQDFQKTKLKVGKARPKNTNATDTSFTAKSIVLKQQSLSESARDGTALFNHNLSLLSSKNETQRRDALTWLTTAVAADAANLPQPTSVVIAKAQPLILDGSATVRNQTLKLLKALPAGEMGSLEQVLLYTRAGLTHLSADIKLSSLDFLDWLIDTNGETVVSISGGWVKTLRTFQNLLSWQGSGKANAAPKHNGWSATKPATNLGSSKLLVHQMTTLSHLLIAGLAAPQHDQELEVRRAAATFPMWRTDSYLLPSRSNPFGYLNLFGAPRDVETEMYEDAEARATVLVELGMIEALRIGVQGAKGEGGEVGRAAAMVDKALRLVDTP